MFVQDPLAPYLWKRRLLVVFAPSPDDRRLRRQAAEIRGGTRQMRRRDLVEIVVLLGTTQPTGHDAAGLRRRYGVRPQSFRVLLIGKDGGVKRTSARPIPVRELIDQIDAMPMRRDEMKRGR